MSIFFLIIPPFLLGLQLDNYYVDSDNQHPKVDSCSAGIYLTAYSEDFEYFIKDPFYFYCYKKITLNIPLSIFKISDSIQYRKLDSFMLKLSKLPELEEITINNFSLKKFPQNINLLVRITNLSVSNSESLVYPNISGMKNLTTLEFNNCSSLNQGELWSNITKLSELKYLYLNRINLMEIPKSIGKLKKMIYLSIDENQCLISVSNNLFKLPELKCFGYAGTKLPYEKHVLSEKFKHQVFLIDH